MPNLKIEEPDIIKINNNGIIKLPEKIQEKLNIKENESLKVLVCNDNLLIKKVNCTFCGNNIYEELEMYKGEMVCKDCINETSELSISI